MTKWITAGVIAIVVIIGAAYWATQNPNTTQLPTPNPSTSTNVQSAASGTPAPNAASGSGNVYFSVADAAANMGNVSKVNITVNNVELHSASSGWVTASTDTQTFDLLQLKQSGKLAFLAKASVPTGTYDQLRLSVSNVQVVTTDNTTSTAKLPSNVLKINGTVNVTSGGDSSVNLDFQTDQSLHMTGNGTYIFMPVINLEAKSNAQVQVATDGSVSIQGGKVDTNVSVGTDVDGTVKAGFKIPSNANVGIDSSGNITVNGSASPSAQTSSQNGLKVGL